MIGVRSNVIWVTISQGGRVLVQLAALTILARLLPAADYGLMAMATVATNLALLLRDLGTSAAIIQRQELSDQAKSTVFWLNVAFGVLIAVILVVLSGPISRAFDTPALAPILGALAFVFPISSLGAVHQALLERNSFFRVLARIELTSATASLVLAVASASTGAGVYSLVVQSVATAVFSSTQLWLVSNWRPKSRPSLAEFRSMLAFSGNLTVFNLINYFSRNADGMVIGRVLGTAQLGAYSMGYKLMLFPVQNLTWVATRALYPVMSRHQDDDERIASLYLRAVRLIVLLTAPLMAGLAVLREPLVALAFGPQWSAVPPILLWLAPTGLIQSVVSTTGTVFMARGRTNVMVWLGTFNAVITVSAFLYGSRYGVVEVAAFYLAANLVNAVPCMVMTMRVIRTPVRKLLQALVAPMTSAGIMAGFLLGFESMLSDFPGPRLLWLAAEIACGAFSYWICLCILFRQDLSDFWALATSGKGLGDASSATSA
jgi:O-antigen/teichoic acid export membrane protein